MNNALTFIQGRHCQQCGSTDREDLDYGDQGYSACCNEIVVLGCDEGACYHHLEAAYQAALDAAVDEHGYPHRSALLESNPEAWKRAVLKAEAAEEAADEEYKRRTRSRHPYSYL